MSTATQEMMRVDLRRRRADVVAHHVWQEIRKHVDRDRERDVFYALQDALTTIGVDMVTDYDRQQLGLPPRGPDGWTPDELVAMERLRLDALMRPIHGTIEMIASDGAGEIEQ
jgi:hypothetical protein